MIDEMLKKLLSAEVLSEETKSEISTAIATFVTEAEQKAEAKVREELANRYETDKKAIVTAMEKYLDQSLKSEIVEFKEGMAELNTLKQKYASAITETKAEAKKAVITRLTALESHVDELLKEEISELHESLKVNRKTYLNKINEVEVKAEEDRQKFKVKAAKILENIIDVKLRKEIVELKEDIDSAKKTQFEGQIFEAFYNTFRTQFFNTNKEFKNIVSKLDESESKLKNAVKIYNTKINEANKTITNLSKEKDSLKEGITRKEVIGKMLANLTGSSKEKMKNLLESTKTENLRKTYERFLPEVMSTPVKQVTKLTESAIEFKSGSSKKPVISNVEDDEIAEVLRLSGVKKAK